VPATITLNCQRSYDSMTALSGKGQMSLVTVNSLNGIVQPGADS
jgi:hypothetical protein